MSMRQEFIDLQNFINAVEDAIENERADDTSNPLTNGPATIKKLTTKRSKHAAEDID